jgi:peptide-methionine (S)-S-oxide reductase
MKKILLIPILGLFLLSCTSNTENVTTVVNTNESKLTRNANDKMNVPINLEKLSKAYFASGCFWCVEAIFESVEGVHEAVSGYSGGKEKNPTYSQVGRGQTSHTEAVEVYYDPAVISYATLLQVYYGSHDPTTVNGQRPDFGTQYRSMILYTTDEEQKLAEDFKAKLDASSAYGKPIATEIVKFEKFWPAEDYHQNYERINPNNSYVLGVSVPRLNRFKAKFPKLLKKEH